ncbi:UDP-N-acetylmuramoyl-L-alanyl-D-glutamate--2,6-diaminopimelate ligase [Hydrogenobacter thermophilus]|uniref:UDP-N-acetylmuramoyl-L-alanyl-D-glutamate--2, 6-diaminopimelate ligase n=1 Tax=Hydrogenobacter thermophilus TaxID=940 RepID=UPI0030F6EBA3
MNIKDLLSGVKGITENSKDVKEDYIFVAIKGSKNDGHDFVKEALNRGAKWVFVERDLGLSDERIVKVEDTRRAFGELADAFYGEPSKKLKVIGITGTNGKTTTTHLIEAILNKAGIKTGLVGTVYYRFLNKIYQYESRTTPNPTAWHMTLRNMLEDGAEAVVAEVSSHALDQKRVWGTRFCVVGFTNLSHDHLDYHKSMENYFKAKLRLFTEYVYDYALVNSDDEYGKRIVKELKGRAITYGKEGNFKIIDFNTDFHGSRLKVEYEGKIYELCSNLVGDFQAYNLSLAVLCGLLLGVDAKAIEEGVRKVYVPGRFETYRGNGFLVIVDYAHTPDALENILKSIRRLSKKRVITVFGAGGNRDRTKRPLMGSVAERLSDLLVITSDNPRDEEPMDIIKDICIGIKDTSKVIVEEDRKKAINIALSLAKPGDIVLVAGKGHEDYQEIKGVRYPFKDSEVIKEALSVRL